MRPCATVITIGVGVIAGCAREAPVEPVEEVPMSISLTSTSFAPGERIPERYTGDGEDVSPALAWSGLPEGTAQLALVCDDPDAPSREPWVHWVAYAIDPESGGLPEGVPTVEEAGGLVQGANSWGAIGYRGPAPPKGHGRHHYHFRLYALDTALRVPPGLSRDELMEMVRPHLLGQGELVGTYSR